MSRASFNAHGHSILAMITTRARPAWPGDAPIRDPSSARLPQNCLVRLKVFTLDNRLIADRIGRLGEDDRAEVAAALEAMLAG